jgi:hypothetical protein
MKRLLIRSMIVFLIILNHGTLLVAAADDTLDNAIARNDLQAVREYIEGGGELNPVGALRLPLQSAESRYVFRGDNKDIVQELIERGAMPDATTSEGFSPLNEIQRISEQYLTQDAKLRRDELIEKFDEKLSESMVKPAKRD